jgi:hypothetical protein
LYDSIVEIIDPEAGIVVVSQRLDAYVWGFAGNGHLATYREVGQRASSIFML